jgi:thioredoxin 1
VTSILEQLEGEHDNGPVFTTVNIDEHPLNAARFGVLSIPTAILFEDGEPRDTVIGARPRSYYERVWAPWLTSAG